MLNFKKIVVCAALILTCNSVFADIASDFKDPNMSLETLVYNALNQQPPVASADIITQLQAAGADAYTIEFATSAVIEAKLAKTNPTVTEFPETCRLLEPDFISTLLNSAYAALAKLGVIGEEYNKLTETVYNTVNSCDAAALAAISETVLANPKVNPDLATPPKPVLAAPQKPAVPGGSDGGGVVSPN